MIKVFISLAALSATAPVSAQTQSSYQYDALGRLVGSTNATGSSTVVTTIGYDAAGNRKVYTVNGAPDGSGDPGSGASVPNVRRFIVIPLNGFTVIPIN